MSAADFMPQVYDELRSLAAGYLRRERPGQTLQATALVHEAYLNLSRQPNPPWKNRTHFLAIAALSMRQILVQRARARRADKRGGPDAERITLGDDVAADAGSGIDVLSLDAALERLAALNARHAKIVELRYFTARTYPDQLPVQRANIRLLVRVADVAFSLLMMATGLALADTYTGWSALFISFGLGALVGALVIEPATARAAFGDTR